jgi:hypothetical protein
VHSCRLLLEVRTGPVHWRRCVHNTLDPDATTTLPDHLACPGTLHTEESLALDDAMYYNSLLSIHNSESMTDSQGETVQARNSEKLLKVIHAQT